jgi:hypothetical protein
MEQQKAGQLNIELPEDKSLGIYANLALINHSHSEFVVDFITVMPGMPKAMVQSRIVLTPQHTKRLIQALADNLARYEDTFGPVHEPEHPGGIPPMGFGPAGQA